MRVGTRRYWNFLTPSASIIEPYIHKKHAFHYLWPRVGEPWFQNSHFLVWDQKFFTFRFLQKYRFLAWFSWLVCYRNGFPALSLSHSDIFDNMDNSIWHCVANVGWISLEMMLPMFVCFIWVWFIEGKYEKVVALLLDEQERCERPEKGVSAFHQPWKS